MHDLKNNSMDMSFKNTQTEVNFPNLHIHTQAPTQTTNHIPHGVPLHSKSTNQSLNGSFEINTWGNGTNGFPRGVFVMALYRDFDKPLWGGMYVCMQGVGGGMHGGSMMTMTVVVCSRRPLVLIPHTGRSFPHLSGCE